MDAEGSPPPPAPPPTFANFESFGEDPDEGAGPEAGDAAMGPPTVNTALMRERTAMLGRSFKFLPQAHVARAGIPERALKLRPGAGEFCTRFCSRECVANSCRGFLRAEDGGGGEVPNIDDIPALKKRLKRIAIRNHPDRHREATVGIEAAARARALTEQANNLQSLLDDHNYLKLHVQVEVAANTGGPMSIGEMRLFRQLTAAELLDSIIAERPEHLKPRRERLRMGVIRVPGQPAEVLDLRSTRTLEDLNVATGTIRVWEEAPTDDWEAFMN